MHYVGEGNANILTPILDLIMNYVMLGWAIPLRMLQIICFSLVFMFIIL